MSPAEELQAAADKLDALLDAVTPGPWRYDPTKHHRVPGTAIFEEAVFAGPAGKEALCIAATGESDDPDSMADAAYIAAMNPAVGRALAALLRRLAEARQRCGDIRSPRGEQAVEIVIPGYNAALNLARAILGSADA